MKRLKQLRDEENLSQGQLAILLGTTQASISKYELGQTFPDAIMIERIAKYFGVSADYLLGISPFRTTLTVFKLSDEEMTILELFRSFSLKKKRNALDILATLNERDE